ncbi:glycosyltransferase family 15 protein [[Candida] arabinofermentans NRRL YB-2248]|uniref:Glycosyltransferase family 15 protein n=1 Tax=[Candida] arabinofermentans NRRL YB-2248 TaxID=983967 RepID=A0A1E4SY55_9ASCO|nr:glycosyltransferase family 15 protein [[Candida] arabinofermentans NRRL YB-2248]
MLAAPALYKQYYCDRIQETTRQFSQNTDRELSLTFEASNVTTHNSKNELIQRENATILSLVRNSELDGMIESIQHVEYRFNKNYHYDWNFFNDEPFTEEFIKSVTEKVSGRAIFTTIPSSYWSIPSSIDQDKMKKSMERLVKENVLYADQISYRHMCRFNSGFFHKMKALESYQYYWRVEPKIKFNCDIPYDVFTTMREENKMYGFNMAMTEDSKTVRGLWDTVTEFFDEFPEYLEEGYNIDFISHHYIKGEIIFPKDVGNIEDKDRHYNLCHFWSNFEIANLDFFRSKRYEAFFERLDSTGNFFYERWGDAPIHTLAVTFMLKPDQLHYFDNTGYFHKPNSNCPASQRVREELNCDCHKSRDFSFHRWSCIPRYFKVFEMEFPEGVHINR